MQTDNFTLGKKDLLILLGLTLVLPFPINWALIRLNPLTLMPGADDVPTWIGFGGSYIGGIIGGVISILILNKTLRQTGVLHHDLKLLQLDTIIYTQQQDWFTGFKQELAENLKSIDLYVLNTIVSSISMKNYAYAKEVLSEINKNLEYQMVAASFSFTSSRLSPEEQKYMQLVRRIQTEYSSFIKDILYYIPLAETMASRKKLNYEQLMDYTLSQYDYLQGQEGESAVSGAVIPRVMEIDPSDNIGKELERIMEERLTGRTYLYHMKSDLAEVTHQLIIYEEQLINAILYKPMGETH
ncbi:hypothetical protein [Bacteroides hominis]|uniref:hypothetical protein n=1 Tax=Bacteroides hominis TaxID=2763023 RepID=UPI00294A782F|nr:hypothetical protein [Bacteroides hominis (ex Liu et al. 2022)]MDV6203636.1 hypothetical protein [Bacteroides hominis (ex Liu et al. 2022)]